MPPTLPSENGKQPARSQNFVTNVNNAINGALERMFEALGRLVGRRPVVVIVGVHLSTLCVTHGDFGVHSLQTFVRRVNVGIPTEDCIFCSIPDCCGGFGDGSLPA